MEKSKAKQRVWTRLMNILSGRNTPAAPAVPQPSAPRAAAPGTTAPRAAYQAPQRPASQASARLAASRRVDRPSAAAINNADTGSDNLMTNLLVYDMLTNNSGNDATSGACATDTTPSFDAPTSCPAPDTSCWSPSDFGGGDTGGGFDCGPSF